LGFGSLLDVPGFVGWGHCGGGVFEVSEVGE
jgi:hypothetical protein